MALQTDKKPSVLRSIDWWTILIYVALLCFGWMSVCGASYTYGETDILSLDSRSGMQIVWIGTSLILGLVLLLLDNRFYDTFAWVIFGVMLILLFGTIFNPHTIKGSFLAGTGTTPSAAGRICEVCNSIGAGKIHEHLRLRHP